MQNMEGWHCSKRGCFFFVHSFSFSFDFFDFEEFGVFVRFFRIWMVIVNIFFLRKYILFLCLISHFLCVWKFSIFFFVVSVIIFRSISFFSDNMMYLSKNLIYITLRCTHKYRHFYTGRVYMYDCEDTTVRFILGLSIHVTLSMSVYLNEREYICTDEDGYAHIDIQSNRHT